VFDEAGQMFTIDGNLNLQKINKPQLKGIVTAYTESPHGSFAAYGTKDGMIYFESKDGLWAELAGHLSQISDLQISGRGLFSSSFDKTVKLWIANEGKGIPITVYTATSWVTCLATKTDGTRIVTGNANGELVVNPISVEEMKNALKLSLKRDLTKDEWDKYIGKTIPYTSIMDKL
jgi:WD40 repeat protein